MAKKKIDEIAAENAAGLDALEGLQPTPGAAGTATQSNRLHGHWATAAWTGDSGTFTMLLFEWEVTFTQEFVDGTAHGEYWDYPVPIKQMWTGRARMYHPSATPSGAPNTGPWQIYMGANNAIYNSANRLVDPDAAIFSGYNTVPGVTNSLIFQGNAYATRASFSAPRTGAATQEVELRGIGTPSVGPA